MRGSLLSGPFLSFLLLIWVLTNTLVLGYQHHRPLCFCTLVSCAHIHTGCSTYAIILVWIRSYHCPFGVCSLCESAAIVLTNWSSLQGEYTWLNIDPMWRGFADGRLTMGHCLEWATLFKSNEHHKFLLYTVGLHSKTVVPVKLWHTITPLTLLVRDVTPLAVGKHVKTLFFRSHFKAKVVMSCMWTLRSCASLYPPVGRWDKATVLS